MALDEDTFLVALYTLTDDLYAQHFAPRKPKRRGQRVRTSDSEVLTLLLCAQWTGRSQRGQLRYAREHWGAYFPHLPSQSVFNRRARDLAGVLVGLVGQVAAALQAHLSAYQVIDSVAWRLMAQSRGERHRTFAGEANVGLGGVDKAYYYGCQVLLAVSPQGVITGFVLGGAASNVRWLAEALLCWRTNPSWQPWQADDLPRLNWRKNGGLAGPRGPIWPCTGVGEWTPGPYIADGGFAGRVWQEHWAQTYQAQVLTPSCYQGASCQQAKARHRRWRRIVETVNARLVKALHWTQPLARTAWGLLTILAAKLAAFNLGVWLNRLFGRPDLAIATLFNA